MKKLIHQIWIGPEHPPVNWMLTWLKHNPTYEYKLWTEKELKQFKFVNQQQLDWTEEYSGKSDIMRYEILNKYGGIYLDADLICIRPLEDYLLEHDAFAIYEHELIRPGLITGAVLACNPNNSLMHTLIDGISNMSREEVWPGPLMSWKSIGPQYLTDTVNKIKYRELTVFPSCFFMPSHYRPQHNYNGSFKPFATHCWGSTPEGSINYSGNNP